MNTNIERKRKYIRIASDILEKEGIEGISIRRIAKEAGCTSAVLYKHFENLDYLITLASIRFLEPYITEFRRVVRLENISSIQMDLYLWKFFIGEAFRHAEVYWVAFFGKNRDDLESCMYDYYSLFPEIEQEFDGLGASIIFSSNLTEREFIRLRRAVHAGLLTLDSARVLSQLTVAAFTGIFFQDYDLLSEVQNQQILADKCYELIYELFARFVNPDTDLSIDGI